MYITGCVYFKAEYIKHGDGGVLVLFAHDTVDPLDQPTEQPSIQCLGQTVPGEWEGEITQHRTWPESSILTDSQTQHL